MPEQLNSQLRVFLAEDDRELRLLIATALRRDGHFVLEAGDGPALLMDLGHAYWQGLDNDTPSLIIADVRMPGRDGLSILHAIHGQHWCPPFILITAFGDERLHAEAALLGVRAVFDKPFDLDDLRAVVRRIAGTSTGASGVAA